ncbi:MAG: hypothetical protein K0U23_00015 [Gammaproteobacteria bacterium]|nr:hypothetical protein [Gammaproteobacteria bacterium]
MPIRDAQPDLMSREEIERRMLEIAAVEYSGDGVKKLLQKMIQTWRDSQPDGSRINFGPSMFADPEAVQPAAETEAEQQPRETLSTTR